MRSTDSRNLDADQVARFATTRWTMVLSAAQQDSPESRQALEYLCHRYWYPLYAYLRRQGHDKSQAEDYVQGFFAHLLDKHGLHAAKPQKCRFRSFLLACLNHFVTDQWRQSRAQRRGGDRQILSLAIDEAETRYMLEPDDSFPADRFFDRSWALTIIERAFETLRAEYEEAGKGELFKCLKEYTTAEPGDAFYRDVADRLGLSEGAARVAAHRLRRRLRDLIRAEIAETVTTPEELEEELRDLFAAFES